MSNLKAFFFICLWCLRYNVVMVQISVGGRRGSVLKAGPYEPDLHFDIPCQTCFVFCFYSHHWNV